MNDIALSQALQKATAEVLREDISLMDNHQDAPGYILFASWAMDQEPTGKYHAYLTFLPHSEATIPFVFGFELTEQMDAEQVKLAVMEAQDKFVFDIRRMERMARADVVSVQGEDKEPVLWNGTSLAHFGKNPFGANIWRVVWAPTRLYMVGGRWTDRKDGKVMRTVDEYRWIPRYGEERGWVLEKWLSAHEYAGSKIDWELQMRDEVTGLYELGPYPSRGEWESCCTFATYPPATAVEATIQMIIYGKQKFSHADIRNAHRLALEGKEAARDQKLEDMIRDSMPAFPMRGMSGSPYRSAPDDFKVTTKDLPAMPDAKDFKQLGNDPSKVN